MFNVGDVVEYDVGDGTHPLAHVDAVFSDPYASSDELVVSFLNPHLHPQTMRVPARRCKLWNAKFSVGSRCECGAEKTHGKKVSEIYHSVWCPIVPKGSYGKSN